MFMLLLLFIGLYIENCKILFMKMSFLFGLYFFEYFEIKFVGK